MVRHVKADPNVILIKYDFNDKFKSINLTGFSKTRKRRFRKVDLKDIGVTAAQKYHARLPISRDKRKDLLHLCDSGVIPSIYRTFYAALPVADNVRDCLPKPDVEENSEDSDA